VQGAIVQGSTVQGAIVQGAIVQGSTVQGVTVQGANVQGSTVQGATVQCATVQGASVQGASVQGAALEKQRNYTNFSNHTTPARITPSRIRVLVLSVGGYVLISLIYLNSRETGYGYRDRSHYSITVAGLQKRRLNETSFINAGSKFQSL
jgi:hypothetical protein